MTNYPKNSAGAQDKKTTIGVTIGAAIVGILLNCVLFAIPGTTAYFSAHDASAVMNWIGGILIGLAWVPFVVCYFRPDDDASSYVKWALIMIVLGWFFAVGFYDTPNDYKLP